MEHQPRSRYRFISYGTPSFLSLVRWRWRR